MKKHIKKHIKCLAALPLLIGGITAISSCGNAQDAAPSSQASSMEERSIVSEGVIYERDGENWKATGLERNAEHAIVRDNVNGRAVKSVSIGFRKYDNEANATYLMKTVTVIGRFESVSFGAIQSSSELKVDKLEKIDLSNAHCSSLNFNLYPRLSDTSFSFTALKSILLPASIAENESSETSVDIGQLPALEELTLPNKVSYLRLWNIPFLPKLPAQIERLYLYDIPFSSLIFDEGAAVEEITIGSKSNGTVNQGNGSPVTIDYICLPSSIKRFDNGWYDRLRCLFVPKECFENGTASSLDLYSDLLFTDCDDEEVLQRHFDSTERIITGASRDSAKITANGVYQLNDDGALTLLRYYPDYHESIIRIPNALTLEDGTYPIKRVANRFLIRYQRQGDTNAILFEEGIEEIGSLDYGRILVYLPSSLRSPVQEIGPNVVCALAQGLEPTIVENASSIIQNVISLPIASEDMLFAKTAEHPEGLTLLFDLRKHASLTVPATVGEDKVVAIGDGVFHSTDDFAYESIVISEGIEHIGDECYRYKSDFQKATISLPTTLKTIGNEAFRYTQIIADSFPSLEEVGETAFYSCWGLPDIATFTSLRTIGDSGFAYSFSGDLALPHSLTYIGKMAFEGCRLSRVFIPRSVNYVGKDAFNPQGRYFDPDRGEDIIVYLLLDENINTSGWDPQWSATSHSNTQTWIFTHVNGLEYFREVDDYFINVFNNSCTLLGYKGNSSDVSIPSSIGGYEVGYISASLFRNSTYAASQIKKFALEGTFSAGFNIENGALAPLTKVEELTLLGKYRISLAFADKQPETIQKITATGETVVRDFAKGCSGVTEIVCEGTTELETEALASLPNLNSVELPSCLQVIGSKCFFNDRNLTSVFLPSNLWVLHTQAFGNCTNLSSVHLDQSKKWALHNSAGLFLSEATWSDDADLAKKLTGEWLNCEIRPYFGQ